MGGGGRGRETGPGGDRRRGRGGGRSFRGEWRPQTQKTYLGFGLEEEEEQQQQLYLRLETRERESEPRGWRESSCCATVARSAHDFAPHRSWAILLRASREHRFLEGCGCRCGDSCFDDHSRVRPPAATLLLRLPPRRSQLEARDSM